MKNQHRREFIKKSSMAAIGLPLLKTPFSKNFQAVKQSLVCQDIANHFKKVGSWVNWQQTTDTFKIGDPSKQVNKVVVAWKANLKAIEEAISLKADLFISHESICANAENRFMGPEKKFALPSELPKFELIENSGLVVYRCHDLWDGFPKIGIRDTWQRELKIGKKIIQDHYPYYVTEIEPITVRDLARHILEQIKPLKQNAISVSGNLDKIVRNVATGTGVNANPVPLIELGAEVGIMTDDYFTHVRQGTLANELDFPLIFVNHGVAEEWGIINLANYIQKEFPQIEVHYIPQYCPYEVIS